MLISFDTVVPLLESYPNNEYFDNGIYTYQCPYFTKMETTQVTNNSGMIKLQCDGILCNH